MTNENMKVFLKDLFDRSGFTEIHYSPEEPIEHLFYNIYNECIIFGYDKLLNLIWIDKVIDLKWLLTEIDFYQDQFINGN